MAQESKIPSPQTAVIRGGSLSIAQPVEGCSPRDTDEKVSNFSMYTYTYTHIHNTASGRASNPLLPVGNLIATTTF